MVSLRQRRSRPSYVGMSIPDTESVDSGGSEAYDPGSHNGSDDEMDIDPGLEEDEPSSVEVKSNKAKVKARGLGTGKEKEKEKNEGGEKETVEDDPFKTANPSKKARSIPSYAIDTQIPRGQQTMAAAGVLPPKYHQVIRASASVLVKSRPGVRDKGEDGAAGSGSGARWKLPGVESASFGPPTPFVTRLNGDPRGGGAARVVWDGEADGGEGGEGGSKAEGSGSGRGQGSGWSRSLRDKRQDRAVRLERSAPLKAPWQLWEGEAYWKEMYVAPGPSAGGGAEDTKGKAKPKGKTKAKATPLDGPRWIARDEVRIGLERVGRARLSDLHFLDESQAKAYLPASDPVVSYVGKHKAQNRLTYEAYGAKNLASVGSDGEGYLFAAGGPVWGMDWCPGPSGQSKQYLAVSTLKDLDDVAKVGERRAGSRASIQIWSVQRASMDHDGDGGETGRADGGGDEGMKLDIVLCFEGGSALEVKWMPLGAWDEDKDGLPKLGILAAVQLDGSVSFYPVYQPDALREALGEKVHVGPIHLAAGAPLLRLDTPDAMCTSLDWISGTRVVVGLSNGHAAVWDVGAVLKGEQTAEDLLPSAYFPVSLAPVRAVSVSRAPPGGADGSPAYGEDPTYVLFGSYDGALSLVDLDDSATVIDVSRQRTPCLTAAWAGQVASPIHADIDFSVSLVKIFGPIKYRENIQIPHRGAVWSIATSDYHTTVVSASADGSVCLSNYRHGFLKRKSTTLLYQRLYEVDYDRHTGEYRIIDDFLPQTMPLGQADARMSIKNQKMEAPLHPEFVGTHAWSPRVGVHKVTFNNSNGLRHAGWLASGGASGLGRVEWVEGGFVDGHVPLSVVVPE